MKYNFDQIPNRKMTESVKWNYYGKDVLPLWVADMDFVSPEPVIRALRERVEHGVFGYPDCVIISNPKGAPELRESVLGWLWERYGWKVQPEDLVFVPGVVTGFNLACHALATPGSGALVQTPVYTPVLQAPGNAGLVRQEMELTGCSDGSYQVDWDALEAAIDERTRVFLLCNPHNPVGRVFRQEELERMGEICLRRNLVICSDEIHCDLVYSGNRHIPVASLSPELARNTITLIAPTKTFNLAGLQCSVAVIQNPELRKKFTSATKGLVPWVNVMGLVAAQAAYEEGQEWLEQLLVYLEGNREYLFEFVQKELPGIRMARPEGTYLAWLDCREAGIDGNAHRFFLEKARVALSDGATFGRGGEGFVRLNFGCPRNVLEDALGRIRAVMRET